MRIEALESRALLSAGAYIPGAAAKPRVAPGFAEVAAHAKAFAKPPVAPAKKAIGSWTVMVYITGDNLNDALAKNILQMENLAAHLPPSVKIVVFWSQPTLQVDEFGKLKHDVFPTENGTQAWTDGVTTGVAVIQGAAHTLPEGTKSLPPIRTRFDLGTQNSAAAATLGDFLGYAQVVAPARRHALIFGDHGAGVDGFNYDKNHQPTSSLNGPKLVQALSGARKEGMRLNVLAFDECMMASTEVEYSVRRLAPWVVASEELEPEEGYAYNDALAVLANRPGQVTPRRLAKNLVASYGRQDRAEFKNDDTLSAVNTKGLNRLALSLRQFVRATASLGPGGWTVLREARAEAAAYGIARDHPFRDLGQFLSYTRDHAPRPRLRAIAQSAWGALRRAVIARTEDKRHSTGLSVVLPVSPETLPGDYAGKAPAFVNFTRWTNLLRRLQAHSPAQVPAETRDWAEPNNTPVQATNLYYVTAAVPLLVPDLTLTTRDVDWYHFRLSSRGGPNNAITVGGSGIDQTDVRLQLYQPAGPGEKPIVRGLVPVQDGSGTTSVSLDGRAGVYYLRVSHARGQSGFLYSLMINAVPPRPEPPVDVPADDFTADTATELGTVDAEGLARIRYGTDATQILSRTNPTQPAWFRFQTPRLATPFAGSITLMSRSGHDLIITLYNENQQVIGTVEGTGDVKVHYRASGAAEAYYFSVGGGAGSYQIFFGDLTPA